VHSSRNATAVECTLAEGSGEHLLGSIPGKRAPTARDPRHLFGNARLVTRSRTAQPGRVRATGHEPPREPPRAGLCCRRPSTGGFGGNSVRICKRGAPRCAGLGNPTQRGVAYPRVWGAYCRLNSPRNRGHPQLGSGLARGDPPLPKGGRSPGKRFRSHAWETTVFWGWQLAFWAGAVIR
jgi:hypothetical protein